MTFGIMRLSRRYAGSRRQDRLRTIQSLHLIFLVYAEHNGALRWIHVQPDEDLQDRFVITLAAPSPLYVR